MLYIKVEETLPLLFKSNLTIIFIVTHVRISEIKQLSPLFFAMLWDIDLIFGMWVYNEDLPDQVYVLFRSGPMIFGRVMCPWTLKVGQIFSCHHFFFTLIWDVDLVFGMWVHSEDLPIKFVILSLLLRELRKVKHLRASLIFMVGTFVSFRHI
jgi:hypothetical protein